MDLSNIKQEPEEHYFLILPPPPEIENIGRNIKTEPTKELSVKLKRFDKYWIVKAKYQEIYKACGKCERIFKQRKFFDAHACDFKCDLCSRVFTKNGTLAKHKIIFHLNIKPFECVDCGFCYRTERELEAHKNSSVIRNCLSCNIDFKCLLNYHKHLKNHGNSFKCNQCPYIGRSMKNLHAHNYFHEKKFACEICGKKYLKRLYLERHQFIYHFKTCKNSSSSKLSCNECGKKFKHSSYLKQHQKFIHSGVKHQCDYCLKKFNGKGNLVNHIFDHIEKVPCKICKKGFSKFRLIAHYRLQHLTEARFKCDLCDRKFKQKKKLKRHIVDVHRYGKFTCACRQKFITLDELFNHRRLKKHYA